MTTEVLVRSEQDKQLFNKYPIIYKRVFFALQEMSENSSKGPTVVALQDYIKHIARCADIECILDNASWAKYNEPEYIFSIDMVTTSKAEDGQCEPADTSLSYNKPESQVINLHTQKDFSYTKPTKLVYFGNIRTGVSSWTDLYVTLFAYLYEDYPHLLKPGMSFSKSGSGRVELGNADVSRKMMAPKLIPDTDLYLETNISASNIVSKIKFLLDL